VQIKNVNTELTISIPITPQAALEIILYLQNSSHLKKLLKKKKYTVTNPVTLEQRVVTEPLKANEALKLVPSQNFFSMGSKQQVTLDTWINRSQAVDYFNRYINYQFDKTATQSSRSSKSRLKKLEEKGFKRDKIKSDKKESSNSNDDDLNFL
jgi:hypothetical protein